MKKKTVTRVAVLATWISFAAIAAEPSQPASGEEMYEAGANVSGLRDHFGVTEGGIR